MKLVRLTGKNSENEVTSYNKDTDYVAGDKEIRKRLSEYEDIGLTPNEIIKVVNKNVGLRKMVKSGK